MLRPLLLISCLLYLIGCNPENKPSFEDWYSKYRTENSSSNDAVVLDSFIFYSKPLSIDTIYRSMQGPFHIEKTTLSETNKELLWITAYESEVVKAEDRKILPPKYMCHNNFNYGSLTAVPWELKTTGSNLRIFTISEGQTKIEFPHGFGIPILSDHTFEIMSQVLNHEDEKIDINSQHRVKVKFARDKQLGFPFKPLYQQSIFVTKQISGPEGAHGLPLSCVDHIHSTVDPKLDSATHDCSIQYSSGNYDPYHDAYGRSFTGHWNLPFGYDTVETNVSQMLDLNHETKIHAIGIHLHPYAEALELWDLTTNTLIYEAELSVKPSGFGFDKIGYYSSEDGIAVFPDHQYSLRSVYHVKDSMNQHSAMAVMYLYMAE